MTQPIHYCKLIGTHLVRMESHEKEEVLMNNPRWVDCSLPSDLAENRKVFVEKQAPPPLPPIAPPRSRRSAR